MTQHQTYASLPAEVRTPEYFTRPVRDTYKHVGARPVYPTRALTPEETSRYGDKGYVLFEQYPESESAVTGRFWTLQDLATGCGAVTKMAPELAETYAADRKFYSHTYCVGCGKHLPVKEFVWSGTDERVGS